MTLKDKLSKYKRMSNEEILSMLRSSMIENFGVCPIGYGSTYLPKQNMTLQEKLRAYLESKA